MSIKDGILIENQREAENTKRIIERLHDGHADWKPHQKSMSALRLASHVVELHLWLKEALQRESFNFHTDYVPLKATSFKELQDTLAKGVEENIAFVNGTDENFWLQNYTLKAGEHTIAELPRLGALRFIINNHLIHHRGQLSLYLRLLDIPVPGIYGPSADEA
ncbi:damage-inducible protein DinB [Elizabethkingia meningoseptica]|uniref:DinB family protein n=1 Tax=Elizabethkingia meningoseptica TaxID=238 RepID=UPI0008415493|nr:DinB family protein [Elizabethkingia meningoseptica]MDE5432071.1 DinB family protein [Elizabethkingia meningoseptica]ODM52519.1 damage-inducible protein DinB [Elizabethkingia meningoseptica]OHT27432.1 damage-inducible protein DinB [Elizabethkingia meningoseptica]OPC12801.1 damage-inducible protein DinB [Elizabethkingia meningoseptica]OPC23408.1 damage-inducible protein DinB [Elizabethkingia meningoseptica]